MKLEVVDNRHVNVELTERNLRALLMKLEREDSERTLQIYSEDDQYILSVKAVPDEAHYADRAPGPMHEIEERRLSYTEKLEKRVYPPGTSRLHRDEEE